jgi:hypothetical protein
LRTQQLNHEALRSLQTTNTTFYLLRKEQRPEWLYSVFWVHDALLGYLILAPFYALSGIRAINGACLYTIQCVSCAS